MKVLASADVHGRWSVYHWLVAAIGNHHVDAMILAGDLLGCPDGFDTPEKAQQSDAEPLTALLDSVGVPVLYIMGNDDLVELNSRSERVQSIHGRGARIGRFTFVGYQYSLPFMGGTFEKPEAEIATDLKSLTHLLESDTVFVSHSPAFGILDPGLGDARIGSRALSEFLDANRCRAHIHGHSHGGFGRFGTHFNVACAGRARAMIVDLETMRHEVLSERKELEPH